MWRKPLAWIGAVGLVSLTAVLGQVGIIPDLRVGPEAAAAAQPTCSIPGNSRNWSGYALSAGSGLPFTAVSGDFVVPTISPFKKGTTKIEKKDADSATWVGVNGVGACGQVDQAGVEQSWTNGKARYRAWIEQTPADPVFVFAVNPGDRIAVYITDSESLSNGARITRRPLYNATTTTAGTTTTSIGPSITVTISDLSTTGKQASMTFNIDRPALTAEWIEEAPHDKVLNTDKTLANYGSVEFYNTWAGTSTGLVEPHLSDAVRMCHGPKGPAAPFDYVIALLGTCRDSLLLSAPGTPFAGGSAFTTTFYKP